MSTKTETKPTDGQAEPRTNGHRTRPKRKEAINLDGPLTLLVARLRPSRWREGVTSTKSSISSSLVVRRTIFYGAVLVADWLCLVATVFGLIPLAGAWLHEQSGLSDMDMTGTGTIALWLGPFAFVVALITVGEIALMKALWRWAGRKVTAASSTEHEVVEDTPRTNGTARDKTTTKKSNRRRKR